MILPVAITPAYAANDRSIYLHYTHTKETQRITYKRNGRFVPEALAQLNVMLRDWRRNEPAKMDPALFDVLWEIQQSAGSSQPIHVVSAYRSPATNKMLSQTTSGVAENSQHMQGRAIDFYIPGVPVSKLRDFALLQQVGGVGYYPTSNTPFIHVDTASVRAWPRLTTAQLTKLFPNGRTLHIPSNGKLLSQEGYRSAQAEWNQCRRVPCSAANSTRGNSVQVAEGNGRNLMDSLFGGRNNQQAAPAAPQRSAPAQSAPTQRAVTTSPIIVANAPTPPNRPTMAALSVTGSPAAAAAPVQVAQAAPIPFAVVDSSAVRQEVAALAAAPSLAATSNASAAPMAAPIPPSIPRALAELRQSDVVSTPTTNAGTLAIAALDKSPTPLARPEFAAPVSASAYASANAQITSLLPDATTTASIPPRPQMRPSFTSIETPRPSEFMNAEALEQASATQTAALDGFANIFAGPIAPMASSGSIATKALTSLKMRDGELIAPDGDLEGHGMIIPEPISSTRFAYFTDPDNRDFSPETELGAGAAAAGFQFGETGALLANLDEKESGEDANTIWVRLK